MLTTLNDDIETAIEAKDKEALAVLRMLKTVIQNGQIGAGCELNGEEKLTVLSRETKRRRDSLSEFRKAGRDDFVEKIKVEIAIIEKYMPQQLTEEETRQLVQEVMTRAGATSPKDFGKMMDAMMLKVRGKADGNQINAIVKELLQGN